MVLRDELRISANRALTERVSLGVGLRGIIQTTVGDASVNDNRDYFRFETYVDWQVMPRLFMNVGYHFTTQEFTNESDEKGTSNTIFLGLSYRGLSSR